VKEKGWFSRKVIYGKRPIYNLANIMYKYLFNLKSKLNNVSYCKIQANQPWLLNDKNFVASAPDRMMEKLFNIFCLIIGQIRVR
jgi:hypothetical protein